jgi:N-acetylglucosamine-6-phosphate deacetylase
MIINNVRVYTKEKEFAEGSIVIRKGRIEAVKLCKTADLDEEVIDGEGCYAIPGLIDLHFHGCKGYDFCDGTKEAIAKIAEYEASVGVTAISPATMTLPVNELEEILAVAAEYKREAEAKRAEIWGSASSQDMRCAQAAADLVGVNMEGPFISEAKKGAQDERNIISCDADICRRFLTASEGLVKFVGIAPERNENAVEFIREMKDKVHISLAHTNADYDTAKEAFDAGADHAVHLYNAMPAFTHRAPGVVGAVSDSAHVNAEMICDGVHIHPSVVRATFKMLGADRIVLISDSMRAAGMPDGQYTLGGLDVNVADGRATLVGSGALAGSATNLMECMKRVVKKMGIPLETAVACASANPAKCLGIDGEYGSIEPGKRGNVVLLDQDLELKAVVKDGVRIR